MMPVVKNNLLLLCYVSNKNTEKYLLICLGTEMTSS